jgi:hypothetical protein
MDYVVAHVKRLQATEAKVGLNGPMITSPGDALVRIFFPLRR